MRIDRALIGTWLALTACSGGPAVEPDKDSAVLFVLFDERHHLEGGEAVRMHEFEIGEVTNVDLSRARVRAEARLDPEVLGQLTEQTTFSVENEEDPDGRYLEVHVLDPEAPALQAGSTVEGVDSFLELTVRRAGASVWFKSVMQLLEDMERELERVDWEAEEEALRDKWEEASKKLERLSQQTKEEAQKGYEEASERVEELIEELEKLGRSEQAQKLRERLEKLRRDLDL